METQASTHHATDVTSVEKSEDHPPHLSTCLGPLFDGQISPQTRIVQHSRDFRLQAGREPASEHERARSGCSAGRFSPR